MQSRITGRIIADTGIPRLLSVLANELSPGDLQSLLLAAYKQRSCSINEPDALARARRSALFAPSSIDGRLLHRFDRIAFETADRFEAVDLSPVLPFGTTKTLGGIDQDNILTTIRNAEVLGDSTPTMALECASRRRNQAERAKSPDIRLCSTKRVVRLQPFDSPGFTPHFRLFSLVSAGRDAGSNTFEIQHLAEHLRFYLELFRALNVDGFDLQSPLVELSDPTITEALLQAAGSSLNLVRETVRAHMPGSSERFLAERGINLPSDVVDPSAELRDVTEQFGLNAQLSRLVRLKEYVVNPLQQAYPEATFRFNLARLTGIGYYSGLCLRISPLAPDGCRYPVVDGGFTDWTARLLQDNKERLVTSGIGSEFVCKAYYSGRRPPSDRIGTEEWVSG